MSWKMENCDGELLGTLWLVSARAWDANLQFIHL